MKPHRKQHSAQLKAKAMPLQSVLQSSLSRHGFIPSPLAGLCSLALISVLPMVAARAEWKSISDNLVVNGDLETDTAILTILDSDKLDVQVGLFSGNPVAGDSTHQGTQCAEIVALGDIPGMIGAITQKLEVPDTTKTYRLSIEFFTEAAVRINLAGYGWTQASTTQCKNDQGAVWEFAVLDDALKPMQGPLSGWTKYQATFGPEGSQATYKWPKDIESISLGFWFFELEKGAKIYLDNIVFEEIKDE